MTLYLEVAVGDGRYLIDAARVLEIRSAAADATPDEALPTVDLRALFGAAAGASFADTVTCTQSSGEVAALLVDRAEGLIDLADADFRSLPPIGPLSALIDAVSAPPGGGRPMLRLRAEDARAAAIARLARPPDALRGR